MRIVHLTPGTGNFHCGSCLRDNALVKALRARGHDAVMVPLYLPHVLDDEAASPDIPVFLGGVNLYLQERLPVFKHAPRWFGKLLDSEKVLMKAADKAGMTTAKELGRMTVGSFKAVAGRQAREWQKLVDWIGAMEPKPDVVSLSNGLLIGIAKTIKKELGIPVVSTLQGEDTFMDSLPEPYLSEAWEAFRAEAAYVDLFVPVSQYYGDLMRERLGLAEEKVRVVLNGIDLSPFEPAEVAPERPTIGYLARMHHGKGLHTLVDAFIELKGRGRIPDAQLRVSGSKISGDDEFIEAQVRKLEEAGLGDDIEFRANIDLKEKVTFLKSLSVLSVPATYGEAFGLYVVEALACGVPVVQPVHGAFPEVLEKCGGGVLCAPDDPVALADELEALLLDEGRRVALGEEGRIAVESIFSVERMAEDFEAALFGMTKDPVPKFNVMAYRYEFERMITFAETDMAGIMHFANFFRIMEEAEHAFWRSLGFPVHPTGEPRTGWPRVHASCDFRKPLRFEDVVTVEVLVEEVRGKAVKFLHRFWLGEELCATGRITAVCVSMEEMKAVAIPEAILAKLEAAPADVLEKTERG